MKRTIFGYSRAAGCASKVCQADLLRVLRQLPSFSDPRLIVGGDTFDDAGVYLIDNTLALVLTVDVLTPVAEDPYVFGKIAAANSLSDVYAMGGVPRAVLCILGYPTNEIDDETIRLIMAGAWEKVQEAEAVVAGGHTTSDQELKFGLAVAGVVSPDRILKNAGAQPGDRLVLTKPLGSGVLTTAAKRGKAKPEWVSAANRVMETLNRTAASVSLAVGVDAATDVTGFGLLGHAWEMAEASNVQIVIESDRVPFMDGARQAAAEGFFPSGSLRNYEYIRNRGVFDDGVSEETRLLLCDAQTSGGLLLAVDKSKATELQCRLLEEGVPDAELVGSVQAGAGRILVH